MSPPLDALLLSRLQFGLTISFHILFPTISIALSWALVVFKLQWERTHDSKWQAMYQFWVKVFALTFAVGVVSGIVMSFQFGTNWPGFMRTVGNVAGPLLAYEILTAFFLEATLLGVMLFGREKVGERLHMLATAAVALGTTLSSFWILALNSWMQTPAGFEMIDGQAHVTSWWQVVFNPSFPLRWTHMMLASVLTVSFVMAGLAAYRWLKGDDGAEVRTTLRSAMIVAAIAFPLQAVVGDAKGVALVQTNPAKIAAMEAIWHTQSDVPAVLVAWPDAATHTNRFEIAIPQLASLYLTHSWHGEVKGIDAFGNDHPPVAPVFFAFRTMVGAGLLMCAASWLAVWYTRRRRSPPRWFLRVLSYMTFIGWVALVAGWYVTEIGRQPWLVHGVLRTADAATTIAPGDVRLSLAGFAVVYASLLLAYVFVLRHMADKAAKPTPQKPVSSEHVADSGEVPA